MSQATAHLAGFATQTAKRESSKRENELNGVTDFRVDANMQRQPDYFIHVFNMSPKAFEVRRPPMMPLVRIPACKPGEKYIRALRLPNIVNQCWQDADTGAVRTYGEVGERVAMDLINPVNTTTNQDLAIDPNVQIFASGDDLSQWGVFWSLNEEPTEEELSKNLAKLERNFRKLIAEADEFARRGRYADIKDDHYLAANHFKYKGIWNTRVEAPAECPLCGNPMKAGVAIHSGPDGCGGVIDWKKAVSAGLKKRTEVPHELRWWGDKSSQEEAAQTEPA